MSGISMSKEPTADFAAPEAPDLLRRLERRHDNQGLKTIRQHFAYIRVIINDKVLPPKDSIAILPD